LSSGSDRIPVPTNGRGPHPVAPSAAATTDSTADPATPPARDPLAMSPERLAVGLGIVASLIILVVGLARRGRSRD
jgi:hypothetical protein